MKKKLFENTICIEYYEKDGDEFAKIITEKCDEFHERVFILIGSNENRAFYARKHITGEILRFEEIEKNSNIFLSKKAA